MTPNAIVTSPPKIIQAEPRMMNLTTVTTYSMGIRPHPQETDPVIRREESVEFQLTGPDPSTRHLTQGTPVHITYAYRDPQGQLQALGINTQAQGTCIQCSHQGLVQVIPDLGGQHLCHDCITGMEIINPVPDNHMPQLG